MAYTVTNFKTKKALKEAVKKWDEFLKYKQRMGEEGFEACATDPKPLCCYNPGLGPDLSNYTGKICLEGPHYPAAHTWYAEAELVSGIVVKVK